MDTISPDDVTRRVLERYDAAGLITACAWCGRADFDGEWPRVPRAALAAIDQQNSLTHSICPTCFARLTPETA